MNEKEYVSGLGFVADVISCGIEKLPAYVVPENPSDSETSVPQTNPAIMGLSSSQRRYDTQQGVKRTCGHSHKSVRVEHAVKK